MKTRLLPLAASLIIAILLVVFVEGFIRQVIVEPLLYVLWLITLVLGTIPQAIFWAIFILITLVIARKSLAQKETTRRRAHVAVSSNQGSVAIWSALLQRAEKREFSKWRLAQTLKKLSQDVLTPDEMTNLFQDEEQAERFEPDLPPEIEAYFGAQMPWSRRASRFWQRLRDEEGSTALQLDPETVVTFLEHKVNPLAGD